VSGDLAGFLAEGGAVVGGGAALGAVIGFVAGSIAHDFNPDVDPDAWSRRVAMLGGGAGLVALIQRG
jgi:hypothetical protein